MSYDKLSCQNIVVDGVLVVDGTLQARSISGKGIVEAGTVSTRSVRLMSVESAEIVAETLVAERVCAAEVKVSGEVLVTCCLEAEYMEARKLTAAVFDVNELHVEELVHLSKPGRSVLSVVIGDLFRRLIAFVERHIPRDAGYTQAEDAEKNQQEAPQDAAAPGTDAELNQDFEFLRLKAMYRFLKHQGQGYTLRITPRQEAPKPTDPAGAAKGQEVFSDAA